MSSKNSDDIRKPTSALPSTRIKLERQLDVLRHYVGASDEGARPTSVAEVAQSSGISKASVHNVNPFFREAGLIVEAEGRGLMPSRQTVEFARRCHREPVEEAASALRDLFEARPFATAVRRALLAEPLLKKQLVERVAAQAGHPDRKYDGALALLVDWLETVGMVRARADGTYELTDRGVGKAGEEAPGEADRGATPPRTPQPTPTQVAEEPRPSATVRGLGALGEVVGAADITFNELMSLSDDDRKTLLDAIQSIVRICAGGSAAESEPEDEAPPDAEGA